MSESKRIVRVSPNTLCREVQGEAVLLQLDSGEYFGLDEIGTRIWQLIVEKADLHQVEAAMRAEFDVDAQQLTLDLRSLVDQLLTKGLIEVQST